MNKSQSVAAVVSQEDDQLEEAAATLNVQPRLKQPPKKKADAKKGDKAGKQGGSSVRSMRGFRSMP